MLHDGVLDALGVQNHQRRGVPGDQRGAAPQARVKDRLLSHPHPVREIRDMVIVASVNMDRANNDVVRMSGRFALLAYNHVGREHLLSSIQSYVAYDAVVPTLQLLEQVEA